VLRYALNLIAIACVGQLALGGTSTSPPQWGSDAISRSDFSFAFNNVVYAAEEDKLLDNLSVVANTPQRDVVESLRRTWVVRNSKLRLQPKYEYFKTSVQIPGADECWLERYAGTLENGAISGQYVSTTVL
jgi:hypothetical protein